jgi:adenosine deaminase
LSPRSLRELPKVDLHVHLEGSIRPSTLRDLAAAHGCAVPPGLAGDRWAFADFEDFINNYVAAYACLQGEHDLRRVAYEFCQDEASEGVRYAEVTFTLTGHAVLADDWDMPVLAVLAGFADGERDFGIRCRLVLDCVHGFPVELAQSTLASALRHRDEGVVALGLGGDEKQPVDELMEVFRRARDEGLHSVPHAGETGGPENVRRAIDQLGAERIGHGIRALEDDDLVKALRDRNIPLEVCPTSNVATGVVASIEEHPFTRLRDAGLTVTLNSDDPGMFASLLAGEYELARSVFCLGDDAIVEVAMAGVEASFLDERAKAELVREIAVWKEKAPSRLDFRA